MTRRESRAARRETAPPHKGRNGLFTGLLVGLVIGLVVAAALAWYFSFGTQGFKPTVDAQPAADPPPTAQARAPAPPRPAAAEPAAAPERAIETRPPVKATPRPPAPAPATATPKPRIDYTFYGILPGDKPAKPVEPPKPTEIWWLQIAALKNPEDADRLKARLVLLGLAASTQKIDSGGQTLHRVRVGPYKREDDAFGDLDILSENNYEPRLFKEPVQP